MASLKRGPLHVEVGPDILATKNLIITLRLGSISPRAVDEDEPAT